MRRLVMCFPAVVAVFVSGCGKAPTGPETAPPVVLGITPAEGTVGTEVRIEGTGFSSRSVVQFDGLTSPRVLVQNGALFAVAPTGLVAGRAYRIQVSNGGAPDSAGLTFTAAPPVVSRVNGVTRPTGLRGMTLILEGGAFSDSVGLSAAKVFFRSTTGQAIQATIVDTTNDWADRFIVTTVPQEIGDVSPIWVETPTGKSDSVEFRIIQSGIFSPSLINWNTTTPLPQPLQALGAVFVPIEDGPNPSRYIFTAGGADAAAAPVARTLRAVVSENGSLAGGWTDVPALPSGRAYHAMVAATPFTAAIDTATTGAFLYVLGGLDGTAQPATTVWVARVGLDGAVDAWLPTTPLPAPVRSPSAVVFAGWVYLVGGADPQGMAGAAVWRAPINPDGTLGVWQSTPALPEASAHAALVSFGPFLYSVGGETQLTSPTRATQTGTETSKVYMTRVDLRTHDLVATGWTPTESMGKARSKHGAIFAGGSILVTSGIYAGNPGSSENSFAGINSDGTLRSWNGATGSETIDVELGFSLYNMAVVTFIDSAGFGHVLVLGGADRQDEGQPSAGVVRY